MKAEEVTAVTKELGKAQTSRTTYSSGTFGKSFGTSNVLLEQINSKSLASPNGQTLEEEQVEKEQKIMEQRASSIVVIKGVALFDFEAQDYNELDLQRGDVVFILQQNEDGWWGGELNGRLGFFPNTYIQLIT